MCSGSLVSVHMNVTIHQVLMRHVDWKVCEEMDVFFCGEVMSSHKAAGHMIYVNARHIANQEIKPFLMIPFVISQL